MYILDANVISELWKPEPHPKVIAWTDANVSFLPAPVLAELQEGAEASPSPRRRAEINARIDALLNECGELILDWDAETARTWGRLQHSREVKRKPQALWDSLLDASAVRHSATIVTRNTADFRHARTLNPWAPDRLKARLRTKGLAGGCVECWPAVEFSHECHGTAGKGQGVAAPGTPPVL